MYTFETLRGFGQDNETIKPPDVTDILKDEVPSDLPMQTDITAATEEEIAAAAAAAGAGLPEAQKAGIDWKWILIGLGVLVVGYLVFKKD